MKVIILMTLTKCLFDMWFTNDDNLMFIKNSDSTAIQIGGVCQVVLLTELRPMTEADHKYFNEKERARRESFGGKSYDALVGCNNGTKANDNHIHKGK